MAWWKRPTSREPKSTDHVLRLLSERRQLAAASARLLPKDTFEAAALRGKAVGYAEAMDLVRAWQRVHIRGETDEARQRAAWAGVDDKRGSEGER